MPLLISIEMSDTVTSIGNGAFRSCYELETVTIGKGLKIIGSYAFSSCFDDYAFESCSLLKNITIPNSAA